MISQFAGTSLWFAGNAILPELKEAFVLPRYSLSMLTSAVQSGFVAGTLVFAFLSLADRISPSRLFFISSIIAALANLAAVWVNSVEGLFSSRFFTGFFLAGIYPVGMKIAADWYRQGLGRALGFLVGSLTLGTAFPHLLRNGDFNLPWEQVLYYTSAFAVLGGLIMLLMGDSPHRKPAPVFKWKQAFSIFRSVRLKAAAGGYFGHMWELYTFWGFLPVFAALYNQQHSASLNIPLVSFSVIAAGSVGCIIGGLIAAKKGSGIVAASALGISGTCCLLSPLLFFAPPELFVLFLMIWGVAVVADSPQFSTLVAANAPEGLTGTALTLVTSIGFALTMVSLYVSDMFFAGNTFFAEKGIFILLVPGPVAGLASLNKLRRRSSVNKAIK